MQGHWRSENKLLFFNLNQLYCWACNFDLGLNNLRHNLNKLLSVASLWNHCWKGTILTSSIDIYFNLYKLFPWLINSFYKRRMHEKGERIPYMPAIFASLTTDVNFAYWPILQLLLSPNAYLKDDVVSCTLYPVLVIAMIEIIQYCTKVSKQRYKT